MKNLFILILLFVFTVLSVKSQNYEAFNKFMRDYSHGWTLEFRKPSGRTMEMVKQVGEPAPEFYFDKKLNSKALKGKFVVINFWSTWCGSCVNLAMDIDTVLFRNMEPYKDVYFIGLIHTRGCRNVMRRNGGKIMDSTILPVMGKVQMLVLKLFMEIIRRSYLLMIKVSSADVGTVEVLGWLK